MTEMHLALRFGPFVAPNTVSLDLSLNEKWGETLNEFLSPGCRTVVAVVGLS